MNETGRFLVSLVRLTHNPAEMTGDLSRYPAEMTGGLLGGPG